MKCLYLIKSVIISIYLLTIFKIIPPPYAPRNNKLVLKDLENVFLLQNHFKNNEYKPISAKRESISTMSVKSFLLNFPSQYVLK